MTVFLINLLKS